MSRDVERDLREVPGEFPRPDERVTREVERQVLALLPQLRRRRRSGAALGAALVAAVAAGVLIGQWDAGAIARSGGATTERPVRSVDLTLICTTPDLGGGWRELAFYSRNRNPAGTYPWPAELVVQDGRAMAPHLAGLTGDEPDGTRVGSLYYNRKRCSQTKLQLPLSRTGLVGGRTEHGFECRVPRRVVVRVRATFRSAGTWQNFGKNNELRGIRRNIVSGTMVVATHPAKKRLAYGTMSGGATTRLFGAASCS